MTTTTNNDRMNTALTSFINDNKIEGFDVPVEQVNALRFYFNDTTTTIKGHVCKQYYHMGMFINSARKEKGVKPAKAEFIKIFGKTSNNDYSACSSLAEKAHDANELVTWYKSIGMRSMNPSRIKETFLKRNDAETAEKSDLEKTKANIDNMLKQLETAVKRVNGDTKANMDRIEGDDREEAINYLMDKLKTFNDTVLPAKDAKPKELDNAA